MSRIPPEVERLMWSLAESANEQAILEFRSRYPEHYHELIRRVNMVHQLRANRPADQRSRQIPTFRPREAARRASRPGAVAGVAIICAAALGAVGYSVTSFLDRTPVQLPPPKPVNLAPIVPAQTQVGPPTQIASDAQVQAPPVSQEPPNQSPAPDASTQQEPAPATRPKWTIPQDLVVKRAPLHTVLTMVAQQGGLTLDIAPGTPNPDIATDYHGMNAVDILKDMGKNYSFTPFLAETDHSVLIIPAVAPAGALNADDSASKHRIEN